MNKGELTRQHIIAKAATVFNERGFAGCSMQDLMKATGLEKGGLYRHFTSKEELAVEAFKYSLRQVIAARMHVAEQVAGAIPRLRQVVRAFVHVPSPVPGGCPLMNAAADGDVGSNEILLLAKEGLRTWKSMIGDILEEGIRNREISADIEPRRTANTIISLLEGALMISRLEGRKEALIDAQATLEGLFSTFDANISRNHGDMKADRIDYCDAKVR